MAPVRTGDLSASVAVLGLLVERSDTTAGIKIRLAEQFPDAHWAGTAVENNLLSLARRDHVRLVRKGHKPALNRYEATVGGAAHFRRWVRETAMVPPVLRDALQGKLMFSEPNDLRGLVATVREEEEACRQRYAAAHRCWVRARARRPRPPVRNEGWETLVREVQIADEANVWGLMVTRLQRLRQGLEALLEEVSSAPTGAARGVADG
jgi:hypothetical protein